MLTPTTVRSKARFWIVSLSWTHTFPSRSRSEMQDHVCPARDSILRAIFKLAFIRRGSLTTRRAISIHAPDQSPCSIFALTDNSEIFASHSLRMARLSFSGNSSVTRHDFREHVLLKHRSLSKKKFLWKRLRGGHAFPSAARADKRMKSISPDAKSG